MRLHSVTYARQTALPDWLAVMQHELGGGGLHGRDDLLMLSAVLHELDTVLTGALMGHGGQAIGQAISREVQNSQSERSMRPVASGRRRRCCPSRVAGLDRSVAGTHLKALDSAFSEAMSIRLEMS